MEVLNVVAQFDLRTPSLLSKITKTEYAASRLKMLTILSIFEALEKRKFHGIFIEIFDTFSKRANRISFPKCCNLGRYRVKALAKGCFECVLVGGIQLIIVMEF